jgi:hypothetical protein
MERWKRYSYDEIAYGVWEKSSEEFCLSSDVEKLEARVEELEMKGAISPPDENGKRTMCLGFHETENVYEWAEFVPVEQFNALESRVKEMDAQCQTHELRSVRYDADMDNLRAENARLKADLVAVRERIKGLESIQMHGGTEGWRMSDTDYQAMSHTLAEIRRILNEKEE